MILRPSPNQHSTWLLIITDNHNFPGNNSISCGCLTFLHSSSSWSDQFRHNIPIFFGMNTSIYYSVDGRPFIGAFRSNQSGNRDSLRLQIPPLIQTKQTPFIPPSLPSPPANWNNNNNSRIPHFQSPATLHCLLLLFLLVGVAVFCFHFLRPKVPGIKVRVETERTWFIPLWFERPCVIRQKREERYLVKRRGKKIQGGGFSFSINDAGKWPLTPWGPLPLF